jgi:hypothetical protein
MVVKTKIIVLSFCLIFLISACNQRETSDGEKALSNQPLMPEDEVYCDNFSEEGMALFGDLHVHTRYSFDAAANSTGATPEDAHRYARGEEIPIFPIDDQGVAIGRTKIDRPLDFLAVTDHGEFLGERALCRSSTSPVYETQFCRTYRADERQGMVMLSTVITTETPQRIPEICGVDGALCRDYAKSPWEDIQAVSNKANSPCEFTSFIAYEYTGTPGVSNYHRNVIFRTHSVPNLPVSYIDAPIDSKLWSELDKSCRVEDGCDYLTIPHNTNLANGRMAPYMQLEDSLDAKRGYAELRMKREPIMEIFQHKGGSECINGLSTVFGAPDELCNVEAVRQLGETKIYLTPDDSAPGQQISLKTVSQVTEQCEPGQVGGNGMVGAGCVDATDFQRSALLVGLKEEQRVGINPIKLGVIAATDTHSANAGGAKESEWVGAVTGEATPQERLQPGLLTSGIDGNPGGLAGVWAMENTRDAIFDAMLRKEVFGTSGPRIRPRLFAGWNFDQDMCEHNDMIARAYATGVPMGGDLVSVSEPRLPTFLAYAAKDPEGSQLQALHLIKGWIGEDCSMNNEVISIAETQSGADSLCRVYVDENFDPRQSAYYYLRAVEPPSPRWHTYDCKVIAEDQRPAVCIDNSYPSDIVEMAWTSPIWYRGVDFLPE